MVSERGRSAEVRFVAVVGVLGGALAPVGSVIG
jgi:hypothetical protein